MCRETGNPPFNITVDDFTLDANSGYTDLGYQTAVYHAYTFTATKGVVQVIYTVRILL
jgi:hypothetical protein